MNIYLAKNLVRAASYSIPTHAGHYPSAIQLSIKEGRLRLCSTNGHTLTAIQQPTPIDWEGEFQIPLSAIRALQRSKQHQLIINLRRGTAQIGEATSPLEGGWFPNWPTVIPTSNDPLPPGSTPLPIDPVYHLAAKRAIRAYLAHEKQILKIEGSWAWVNYLPIPIFDHRKGLPVYVTQINHEFLHLIMPIRQSPTSGFIPTDWV